MLAVRYNATRIEVDGEVLMPNLAGVFLAVLSALVWGTGDFAGGMAARRASPYRVLRIVSAAGLLALLAAALIAQESEPRLGDLGWAVLGGAAGSIGIVVFYRGLAEGSAAIVSPTAAVVGAGIPVLVGVATEGAPSPGRMLGILIGLLGIWQVSRAPSGAREEARRDLLRGLAAGLSFAAFFVCLGQVRQGSVFYPLVMAKAAALVVAVVVLAWRREGPPAPGLNTWALGAGVLDAAGNAFYVLARQRTRLDVAAVVVSMYPALTVLLARGLLQQRVSSGQWAGIGLCLASVGLIAA
jgi:drug/metabolite transporter (DMT)-like permease